MSFPAFSGLGDHANKCQSVCLAGLGPIPPGTYYILDRQTGGRLGAIWDRIYQRQDWFALYANDGRIVSLLTWLGLAVGRRILKRHR
jgi:hypothetical protein